MIKTVFDVYADVLNKRSGGKLHLEPNFKSVTSNFMLCRLLRMRDEFVPLASILNRVQSSWSGEEMYLWLYKNLPRSTNTFVNYIKKPSVKKEKEKTKTKENGFTIL